ncbi:MAG TPA: tetratricopeptide repeat protein [Methanomassiliicoccales archaeon]
MERKNMLLKPMAVWLVFAGILTIVTIFYAIFAVKTIGVIVGVLLMLLLILIAAWELTVVRSVWGSQVGERENIIRAMTASFLARILIIYLILDVNAFGQIGNFGSLGSVQQAGILFVFLSLISAAVEITVLFIAVRRKEYFQPSKEELENALRKMGGAGIKSVSECPKCKELVELDWSLCPNCGAALPKYCANCGNELTGNQDTCPKCGANVEPPKSLNAMVQTLKASAESPAMKETSSARYARLAEAQLKNGDVEGAVDSYRKAIQYTEFNRKRTNFMVKMAMVLYNTGKKEEAMKLLEESLSMEPEDWAGAKKVIDNINAEEAKPKGDACTG